MKIKDYYKEKQYIHYSNCHEDSEFMLSNISCKPKKILSIASALDNCLALLLLDPDSVLAIDINDTQIYLCNLKKCGIKYLDYESFLTLIGIAEGDSFACYESLREYLDGDTLDYFDGHIELIRDIKLVNCGRFEYYFSVFAKRVLPLIHSKKTVESFMNCVDIEEQREFYHKKFDDLRFRLMFKLFFSETVMKRLGRDKEYFKYNNGSLSKMLKGQFERCVENNLNLKNPYFQYVVLNRFYELPTYLQRENFDIIKSRIDRLTVRKADFAEVMSEGEKYDLMYLSDIFEYMDASVMPRMSELISNALTDGGEVMFFNMMNPRKLIADGLCETALEQTHNLTFYYTNCYLYKKKYDK